MNDVLKTFLSLSLSGSLVILLLFLCKLFWKDKVSRQWQYYLWLIVIARLLLPFAPETNLMGNMFQIAGPGIFQTAPVPLHGEQDKLQDTGNSPAPDMAPAGQGESRPHIQTAGVQPLQDIITLLANNIWLVWLIIAFVLLIRKITVYESFVRYVKAGQVFVSDIGLLDRLSVLTGQAGMKKPVELCVNPLVSSPLLIGFFRPYIVLPSTDISEKDFRYTVLHELTHVRRGGMFYKWLVQVTVCLHWFNPLVYVMSREINKACEFSCDEAVIVKLNYSSVQEYGKTLLDAMLKAGNYMESLGSVTLNKNKELLKERLGAIMNFKKKSKLTTAFSILVTAALLCSATFTGAYAATANDVKPNNIAESNTAGQGTGTVVINLSNNKGQNSLIHSSSFQASDGQVLTLKIKSTIKGTVDLVLFSPSYKEQRITMDGNDDTKTISLSEGTWAYNCTGFFDSGDISIIGTIK